MIVLKISRFRLICEVPSVRILDIESVKFHDTEIASNDDTAITNQFTAVLLPTHSKKTICKRYMITVITVTTAE